MPVHFCTIIFFVASCATAGYGRPVLEFERVLDTTATESTLELTRRNGVGFEGSPGLYGLGIRVGIYCQLVSSLLANHYHREIMQDAWDTVRTPWREGSSQLHH
jgi:hypothetical protein